MAHGFLADHLAILIMHPKAGQLSWKMLREALWKVEETVNVFDWLNQHKCLLKNQRKVY